VHRVNARQSTPEPPAAKPAGVRAGVEPAQHRVSRYTHVVPMGKGRGALYNTRTGAILVLSGDVYENVRRQFSSRCAGRERRIYVDRDDLTPHLRLGGFIVEAGEDELAGLREQYELARSSSQFLLTIIPTFACNLACDYCFVASKRGTMSVQVQDAVIDFVRRRLQSRTYPSLSVDWFGGEPTLALSVIERLSRAFTQMCEDRNVRYAAQVITNGTRLSGSAVEILERSRVTRLQITLDGAAAVHDRRRPHRSGGESSYRQIMEGLERVVGRFLVRLRINVDQSNANGVWMLLDDFERRGWLSQGCRFYPYLARLSPLTDACASVSQQACSLAEYQTLSARWMRRLARLAPDVIYQPLYQFPEPKLYNCGAVGANGFVFTPSGDIHKCGLMIDEPREAVGRVDQQLDEDSAAAQKWKNWNPFDLPECRECSFLPSCLGGCPRNRLLGRKVELRENCRFFKEHERRLLRLHVNLAARALKPARRTEAPQP
jgi:uncharacterized protein